MAGKLISHIAICILLLAMTGCAKHMVITDSSDLPVRMHVVPEFVAGKSVNLVGEKTLKETKLVSAGAYGTYYAGHQQWAETAVKLVEAALRERGVSVNQAAQKKLEISLFEAEYDSWSSLVNTTVKVKLRVKTGDGIIREYFGLGNRFASGGAAWGSFLTTKSNHALTKAVEAMLNDQVIISYLNE